MNKIILLLAAAAAAQTPNLDFLTNQVDGRELRQMLPRYQKAEVERRRRATPVSREEFRRRFVADHRRKGGTHRQAFLNEALAAFFVRLDTRDALRTKIR